MKWAPFTAHIRISPVTDAGDEVKRFETWRDMQRIGNHIYSALENTTDLNITEPGGGQFSSRSGAGRGGIGGLTRGTAVKPELGDEKFPAQAMISGFHATSENLQANQRTLIHAGEVVTGVGHAFHEELPPIGIQTAMLAMKALIELELDADLPGGVEYTIYRIDYAGIIFGNRGHSFGS